MRDYLLDENIIWQIGGLYQKSHGFTILLDPVFAKQMFDSKLSEKAYQRMQALPLKLMNFFRDPQPYRFHEDTAFLRQINLEVGNGKWLDLDDPHGGRAPEFDKPIKYSTHNLDYMPKYSDIVNLAGLFELWVAYSPFLVGKE